MSVDITIRVPDELGRQLEQYRDRLPELLERGPRDVQVEDTTDVNGAADIIAVLTSQTTPEQLLALKPSEAMQARVRELLRRSKVEPWPGVAGSHRATGDEVWQSWCR